MNAYWWEGSCDERKGIKWKAWNGLCKPKKWGGMGFRNLRNFNVAMLCKQSWRIMQNPDSLVARFYKARYFTNSSFLEARKGGNPSLIWSSLLETQEVIRRHSRWRVGNGEKIRIWHDDWLPDINNKRISTFAYPFLEQAKMASLLKGQGEGWALIWPNDENGKFNVKSCYRALTGEITSNPREGWTSMWNLHPPAKKNKFWQACTQCLPTADLLIAKKVDCPRLCYICSKADESIFHIFVECDNAKACWNRLGNPFNFAQCLSFSDWVQSVFMTGKSNVSFYSLVANYGLRGIRRFGIILLYPR